MVRSAALLVVLFATLDASATGLLVKVFPSNLTVDAQNNATATVRITNDSQTPQPILLTMDDFRFADGASISPKVQFSLATALPSGTTSPTPGPDFEHGPLGPNETIRVRIDISNLWQAGVSKSALRNRDEIIATLAAMREPVPFNVRPIGWKEDAPLPLRFCKEDATGVILKNEDPQTYEVDWTLSANGLPPQNGHVRITGQKTTPVAFERPKGWIPAWYSPSALLRPRETDGVLSIVAGSSTSSDNLPGKEVSVPVKIRHSYWSDTQYQWVTFLLLATFLAIGGVTSFLLTYWIPNRLRRISVRELIDNTASKIRAVSPTIASSLRVGVRVERQRLLQRLDSRSTISPDFAALATECEEGAKRLVRVIDLLERADQVLRKIDRDWPKAGVHGPTLLRRACMLLREAESQLDRPEITDDLIAHGESIVHQAEGTITSAEVLDAKMVEEVSSRVAGLRKTLDRNINGRLSQFLSLEEILTALPSLKDALHEKYEKSAELTPENFCELDLATTKLELVERFVDAFEAVVDSKKAVAREHLRRFQEALRRTSFSAFRDAESLVDQTEELVFAADAQNEIKASRVDIRFDPQSPKVNQAVTFRAEFKKKSLNADEARNALTSTWHFVHAEEQPQPGRIARLLARISPGAGVSAQTNRFDWVEEGFSVSHYFPTPEQHMVWLEFSDQDGLPIESAPGQKVRIEQTIPVVGLKHRAWGERTRIEVMRLVIAIAIAIFALLGGAQEQISKVDLVPGLIAVFLLGYSADQIKNVFK